MLFIKNLFLRSFWKNVSLSSSINAKFTLILMKPCHNSKAYFCDTEEMRFWNFSKIQVGIAMFSVLISWTETSYLLTFKKLFYSNQVNPVIWKEYAHERASSNNFKRNNHAKYHTRSIKDMYKDSQDLQIQNHTEKVH